MRQLTDAAADVENALVGLQLQQCHKLLRDRAAWHQQCSPTTLLAPATCSLAPPPLQTHVLLSVLLTWPSHNNMGNKARMARLHAFTPAFAITCFTGSVLQCAHGKLLTDYGLLRRL